MESLIQQITSSQSERESQDAAAAVVQAVRDGQLTVLRLVGLLQRPLTDDVDHEGRAKAVQLLSQVSGEAPEALKAGDVGVLAEFLAGKLSDWRCLTAAVPGCLALLQRHQHSLQQPPPPSSTPLPLAPLPTADAVRLVERFVKVHVQGLDYRRRLACYELLLELLQGPFAVPSVLAGIDLAYFTVVAMENEADPRCLLVALQCVEAIGHLYQRPELSPPTVSHLQDNVEDLFDACVVPYFPIIFNAPKNDSRRITREMLQQRVIAAMACCPDFAHLAIPVISEKLGSSLKQAKEDALAALPVCCKAWGAAAVKPHLQAVWLMLKSELMAPASAAAATAGSSTSSGGGAGGGSEAADRQQSGDQLVTGKQQGLAARAAAALRASTAALGPGLLDSQVLNDVAVEDLMQYLGLVNPPWGQVQDEGADGGAAADGSGGVGGPSAEEGWHLPDRAQKRLACIATCVAAVAGAGGDCTAAACTSVLQPAVTAVLQDTAAFGGSAAAAGGRKPRRPLQANCGVLCVLHESIQAVTTAAATAAAGSSDGYAALAFLLPDVVEMLGRLQRLVTDVTTHAQQQQEEGGVSSSSPAADQLSISQHEEALQQKQLQLWLVLLWQDLPSLPASIFRLSAGELSAAAHQLLQLALHGSTAETALELSPGAVLSEHSAAAKALTQLAARSQLPSATADVVAGRGDSSSAYTAALSGCATQLLQLLQSSPGGDAATAAAAAAGCGADAGALRGRAVQLMGLLAGSSAAAAWQVLQWLQPVILQQVQRGAWADLTTMLPLLNSSSLLALPADFPPQQSAEAAAFCNTLLETWQQQHTTTAGAAASGDSTGPNDQHAADAVLLQACLLVGHLAAKCSLSDQRQVLLMAVCAWVMSAAARAAGGAGQGMDVDAPPSKGSGAPPVCIALAVLAAARPGLLTAASTVDLVQAAATLAVSAQNPVDNDNSSSSNLIDSTVAAVALAGILNKSLGWSNTSQRSSNGDARAQGAAGVVQPEQLLAAAVPVLVQPLQQQQKGGDTAAAVAAAVRAMQALAWVGRALAMQRHDAWQELMQQHVLPVLAAQAADAANGLAADGPGALTWAAAEFFAVLVAPPGAASQFEATASSNSSSSTSLLGHQLSLHSMARPLWQQKAFVLALEAVQQAATTTGTAATGLPQQREEGVWLALASLVSAAPAALSATGQQPALLLLQCVVHLHRSWQALTAAGGGSSTAQVEQQVRLLQLLRSCLLLLGDAVASSSQGGAAAAEGELAMHIETMLLALASLARLQPAGGASAVVAVAAPQRRQLLQLSASVREVAIMCLTSCMDLPYHLLHPHRRHVLEAVTAALDDDRRAVRRAAVVCKGTWSSS